MGVRRILCLLCLFGAVNGYAFKVQYGNFFTIERVAVKQDVLVLPLTRGEREDIRILDKRTFETVKNCAGLTEKEVCLQEAVAVPLRAGNIIPAEKECRWRVSLVFNEQWLVRAETALADGQFKVFYPPAFAFVKADKKQKRVSSVEKTPTEFEKQVSDFIQHKLQEVAGYEMCARADR